MTPPAPQAELMRSLGQLVRGLSALFWGLPLALVVCVQTAKTNLFAPLGIIPPILAHALLFYGLLQLGHFQKQERVWRHALDRAKVLGVVNIGLGPFLYWWKVMPDVLYYQFAVGVLALSGLIFLFNVNQALQRLAAMLPDETLRLETKLFTSLNRYLVVGILLLIASWTTLDYWQPLPASLLTLWHFYSRTGTVLSLLLLLLPVALTMALIWKIKEVILASVFAPGA